MRIDPDQIRVVVVEDTEYHIRPSFRLQVKMLNTPVGEHPVATLDLLSSSAEVTGEVVAVGDHPDKRTQLAPMLDRLVAAYQLG